MEVAGRGARVLIADDKADIRTLIAARLGLDPTLEVVGEASNGAEAITKVGDLQPTALILDLHMPVMSGEEAIPILRSLAPDLRILVFSAYVGVQSDLSGSWRPDAEIAKGGDLRKLVQEVHRLLAGLPEDLLRIDLGIVDIGPAQAAIASWARLAPEIREVTPPGTAIGDLLAVTGIFLSLGEQVRRALVEGLCRTPLIIVTRRAAAEGARRSLAGLAPEAACHLEPLYQRLLAALPE